MVSGTKSECPNMLYTLGFCMCALLPYAFAFFFFSFAVRCSSACSEPACRSVFRCGPFCSVRSTGSCSRAAFALHAGFFCCCTIAGFFAFHACLFCCCMLGLMAQALYHSSFFHGFFGLPTFGLGHALLCSCARACFELSMGHSTKCRLCSQHQTCRLH